MEIEYISREAAIKILRKAEALYRKCMVSQVRADMIDFCIKLVNDILPADVQPIVHCKDCIYKDTCEYLCSHDENWFCGDGKRKQDL